MYIDLKGNKSKSPVSNRHLQGPVRLRCSLCALEPRVPDGRMFQPCTPGPPPRSSSPAGSPAPGPTERAGMLTLQGQPISTPWAVLRARCGQAGEGAGRGRVYNDD